MSTIVSSIATWCQEAAEVFGVRMVSCELSFRTDEYLVVFHMDGTYATLKLDAARVSGSDADELLVRREAANCSRMLAAGMAGRSSEGARQRRADKLAVARAAIGQPEPMPAAQTSPQVYLEQFTMAQRENDQRPACVMRSEMVRRGSAEWSRQLREKVAASERKERHQVLVDLQDEP